MKNEKDIVQNNFFIINSDNIQNITDKLYGFGISEDVIVSENNKKGKKLDFNGAYVNIEVNDEKIIISQDFMGSYGLYYFESEKGYFALSNSFLMIMKELIENHELTLNKKYSDAFLFVGLCSIYYNETIINEIKVLPRNYKVIINKKTGQIQFDEIDFEEHSIPINSRKAIEVLDQWYEKWVKIIRNITKNTGNISFELSGGFDSRVVASLWLTANIDLKNLSIISSEKEVYKEDFEIANQIADKFNFKLNNELSTTKLAFDNIDTILNISFHSKMAFHNSMYFQEGYCSNPVYTLDGGGGECVRNYLNQTPTEYINNLLYKIHNMDSNLKDSTRIILERSIEEIKNKFEFKDDDSKEIVERLYKETRARYHFGNKKIEHFIANKYSLSPLLDPLLHKIKLSTDECDDEYLLISIILTRYCPELLNFKIEKNRNFNENTLNYAKEINEKHPYTRKTMEFINVKRQVNKDIQELKETEIDIKEYLSKIVFSKRYENDFTKLYSKQAYDKVVENYYIPFNYHIYALLSSLSIIVTNYYLNTRNNIEASHIIKHYLEKYEQNNLNTLVTKYSTASIEIKYKGKPNSLEILNVSDKDAQITIPRYFEKNYEGYKIESNSGLIKIECISKNEETILIELKSLNYTIKKPYDKRNNRLPINIDYKKLYINNEKVFDNSIVASFENPYVYKEKIKKDEKFNIMIEWLPVNKNSDLKTYDRKINTEIIFNPITDVNFGKSVDITGKILDENKTGIPNETIKLLINNARATTKTNKNGTFTYLINKPKPGTNTITALYQGNKTYQPTVQTKHIEIKQQQTKITLNPIKKANKGEKIQISGTLTTNNDNPLPNAQIIIYINQSPKTIKVDEKGNFTFKTQLNKTGTHNITIQYPGNNTYQPTTAKTTIEVTKEKTKITMDPIEKVFKGDEIVLSGSVATYNNISISNVQIKILINGSPKTLKADENGHFMFTYKMNRVGINDIEVLFKGNNTYEKCSLSMKLEVFNK